MSYGTSDKSLVYSVIFNNKEAEHGIVYLTKTDALKSCNAILMSVKGFNLLEELHTMRNEVASRIEVLNRLRDIPKPCHPFDSIYNIPDYFINLILKEHNMRIEPHIG